MMESRVFLDSSYAIALASRTDEHHAKALQLSAYIASHRVRVLLTRAVCFEIGNALARPRFRSVAVQFLDRLESSGTAEIVPMPEDSYHEVLRLYRERADKDWSLTDCLSFLIMHQHGLTEALTSDEHFEQAGFKALLRHIL
jgi:uncharacterized protein